MGPDWLWVFTFSLGGLAMGFLTTLVGMPKGGDFLGWLGFYAFFVASVVILEIHHPFWTFLLGSMSAGLVAGSFEAAMLRRFRDHNPWFEELAALPTLRACGYLLVFSISVATVLGVFVGGLAWGLSLL